MPNINLDDAYILGETGAQVDKVTGLYFKDESTSAAEKAFAQLNIGTAGSNRNLLDNPWFTVNQRSFTSTSSGAYFADRWQVSGNTYTLTRRTTGITIKVDNGVGYLFQKMESAIYDFLDGKTVTYSFRFSDGTVVSRTFVWDKTKRNYPLEIPNDPRFQFWYGDVGQPCLRIFASSTGYDIDAIKLELGSVSTLANDAPPEYDTALWHCQRARWQNTGSYIMAASAVSATHAIVVMPLPNVLFKTPTLEQQGAFVLADRVNAGIAVTTIQLISSDLQTCALLITTSGGLTRGVTYGLALNGTGHLALNADL